MSNFTINPGDGRGDFKITQNVRDVIKGMEHNDYSRISSYRGGNEGLHTGNNSATVGRHDQKFGK
jgi:hypothetical protein